MPSGSGDLGFSSWYSQLCPGADTTQTHRAPRMATPAPSHLLNGRKSRKPPQNHHRSASFGFPVNHNPPNHLTFPPQRSHRSPTSPLHISPINLGYLGTRHPQISYLYGLFAPGGFLGSVSPKGAASLLQSPWAGIWPRVGPAVLYRVPGGGGAPPARGRILAAHVSPTHLRGPYGVTPMIPLPVAPLIRSHRVVLPD